MSLQADIDAALGEIMTLADSEQVTIYSGNGNQSWTGTALVTSGAGGIDDITGGYFNHSDYTVSVRKSDLTTFTPAPGMLVSVRSKELRISNDGLFDGRAHWRLSCVDRDQ